MTAKKTTAKTTVAGRRAAKKTTAQKAAAKATAESTTKATAKAASGDAATQLPAVHSPDGNGQAAAAAGTATRTELEVKLLSRDMGLLRFNERVLAMATREEVPLLERLRYICIVSSNMDEFFEVRLSPGLIVNDDELDDQEREALRRTADLARALVQRQYAIFNDCILPELAQHGIRVVSHSARNAAQRRWVKNYFEKEVRPLLTPIVLDPAHPFPMVANKYLHFILQLSGRDAFGRENEIAIIKVTRTLPRLIRLPRQVAGKGVALVSLSSIIRSHLTDLFPGREVVRFSQFRVTRHADLEVDEYDVEDLRVALRKGLHGRNYGQAMRLEVSASCTDSLAAYLTEQFALPEAALYRVNGPVNLVRFFSAIDLIDKDQLLFKPFTPKWPKDLKEGVSYFKQLRQRNALIHLPFESFDGVVGLLRQAVADPKVAAIRQTIYRTAEDSEMMALLLEAVRKGKEVTVVVEIKARFDEEANINWAERLEKVGATVLYGVVGLKTHAKMLLITRREKKGLRLYGHLSTGNYNAKTARLYTDIGFLTADPEITRDMETLFLHLASQSKLQGLSKLLVSPTTLKRKMLANLEKLASCARQGKPARVIAKMNSLTDAPLINGLLEAGQAGVQIDLIVRGACMLPAQREGMTDNIRVRSIVGRFLEHPRIYYFLCNREEEMYLSSADWMTRNMDHRIELAWPLEESALRQRVMDEALLPYLEDNVDAWEQRPDGTYVRVADERTANVPLRQAQMELIRQYS